ncbi:PaaI family thioesterase [Caulobacter sp. NIBR2454]|uniref:PaaI family thioesterase n=1 Tax=Caulobacter sp. NIBR2454 TaxID=3015996 RepID=UPI002FC2CFC7
MPPDGFEPHARKSPVTDPWEPLFARTLDDRLILGLEVREPHTNSRGLLHGGLIAALVDNAMGLSCGRALEGQGVEAKGLVTVSLSLDYLGMAKLGQWLAFDTHFVKAGKTLCFAEAGVTADGATIARASASFRVLN